MSLIPWKREFPASTTSLQQEINRLFDDFFAPTFVPKSASGFFPAIAVKDGDKQVTVTAELPGLEANDVDVSITGTLLTISGEKKEEKKEEKENFFRLERSFGSFVRRIELPSEVDSEHAEAKLQNGVLELRLPKLESQASKSIKIKK